MLASITPLGERGRRSRWGVTVTAFVIGATVAGVAFGAVLGVGGGLVLDGAVSGRARLVVLSAVLVLALAVDVLWDVAPGPRRQVNERWLDEFRGWVYGVGFGAQLGLGVTTIVTSAATYVAIAAAVLVGGPVSGAIVLGCYGAVRGAMPLLAARVDRPEALIAMHRRIDRWRAPAARFSTVALAGVLVVAAAGSLL